MQKPLALTLAGALVLAGCGWKESRINPVNWFGNSEPVEVVVDENTNPLIPQKKQKRGLFDKPEDVDNSVLVGQLTELRIDRTNIGAIIYATAIADRQGAFDVELRPLEDTQDGVLTLEFRVVYPEDPTHLGSEYSRTVHAARSVTQQGLDGIRLIRVLAAQNARESRR